MFSKETYVSRRAELKKLVKSGIVVLFGNNNAPANFPNNGYHPFRQDSSFLYYFGQNRDGLVGVIDVDNNKETFIGDDISIDDIVWYGAVDSVHDMAEQVGVSNSAPMKELAKNYIDSLAIKCTGPEQKAGNLSGGNQQKICLAKAFAMNPELLFVSEPTRGIDIGAKQLVLEALEKFNNENNTTIVMVSSELEELRSICDRIAVICEGKIAGILPADASPEKFGLLMSGESVEV